MVYANRVNTNEGVGVLLADNHGLCLSTAGDVDPKSSGIISAIAQHVSKLEPSSSTPVICISGDQGKILIKQGSNVTTAIFKPDTQSGS
ncbi:uncharacterized protein LOC103519513 [Diaphorina citri]|uniref:Late endosomal/lysosomal adaptor and MAPK and MTOR activator 5 n=1 Tax=Diaphorina citri TaxID=121845 RepID=A0A1S3DIT3_DIACI|nr:uncharacterized protein LOC103519513 [Diaphorina citri]